MSFFMSVLFLCFCLFEEALCLSTHRPLLLAGSGCLGPVRADEVGNPSVTEVSSV